MNTKLKCLLLDDELPALAYMRMLLSDLPQVDLMRSFSDSQKFFEEAPALDFDFAFLDIQMPALTGIELVKQLKGIPVVFVSAHKEFAVDAYDLEVIDFIPKPVQKERLLKAIEKVKRQLNQKPQLAITFNTNKGKQLVMPSQIIRITVSDTDRRDKLLITELPKPILLKNYSFDEVLALLPKNNFFQINKRDIISLKAVIAHSAVDVRLRVQQNEIVLPLSDVYKSHLLEGLKNFGTN